MKNGSEKKYFNIKKINLCRFINQANINDGNITLKQHKPQPYTIYITYPN